MAKSTRAQKKHMNQKHQKTSKKGKTSSSQKKKETTQKKKKSSPAVVVTSTGPQIPTYEQIQSGKFFKTPAEVQALVDALPYNTDKLTRCPKEALLARKVHCFDGALLACAALKHMNYPGYGIVYLNAVADDGHALCVFKSKDGKSWGAIGKSNFSGLRYRDPIYPDIKTLVYSYFDNYFNIRRKRTLRGYTNPIALEGAKFDKLNWEFDNKAVPIIEQELYKAKEFKLLSAAQEKSLTPVDERSAKAGMLGIDLAGCYGAKNKN
jgi:hypothetical protein